MDQLERQVRRARRRMAFQRFVAVLGWCWFAAILAAALAIGVGKFHPLPISDWMLAVGALFAGLLAAVAWTLGTLPPLFDAAAEMDRRFGLKERVASTWALLPEDRESEAGKALTADTVERLRRVDVAEKFPLRMPRLILLPLAPALVAALVAWLVPAMTPKPTEAAVAVVSDATRPEVKRSTEDLRRRLTQRRQQAENLGLEDATQLLKKLEQGAQDLAAEPKRDKALVKLNDLARQLQQRRLELGSAERIRQQLEQLRTLQRGPADKFTQALARGDFKKAAEELQKLKEELSKKRDEAAKKDPSGKDDAQQQLAKQFDQLQQKLNDLAQAGKQAQSDLQQRAEQLRQDGRNDEAAKLEDQIAKLTEQGARKQDLQQLARQLGDCAKCLEEGKADQAAKSLDQAMNRLQSLQRQLNELREIDESMGDLAEARQQMTCQNCKGAGCEMCRGGGAGSLEQLKEVGGGEGGRGDDGQGGREPGHGRGGGLGPERATKASFFDSQVRQKVGKGGGVVTDLVDGPNIKGNVTAEIEKQSDAVRRGSTDPMSGRRLPRKQSEHAREYFDRFRDGK